MNTKFSKNLSSSSTPSTSTEDSSISLIPLTLNENSIITLLPCEYDPIDGYGSESESESEDSLDSSEIVDSSDDELEAIKINEIHKSNEMLI